MDSFFSEGAEQIEDIREEADTLAAQEHTPRSNPDLLGHEETEKRLLDDYNAGRMPHAIILAGPSGIGKATLAYRLARFLFAEGDGADGLFGGEGAGAASMYIAPEHPIFRRVASGGHADLLTIEREFDEKKGRLKTEISAEAARSVAPFLRKTAAEGGWRVVIVDSAEYLNAHSQNALLKILEEPPKKSLLILTTSQPGAFLPTVRSRCRLLPMLTPPEKTAGELLDKMTHGLDQSEKTALCRLAECSIGRALQLQQSGGVALYKDLLALVATLPDIDVVAAQDMAEKICKKGDDHSFDVARDILTGWCERQARAEARGNKTADITPGDGEIFARLSALYPPRHFLNTWEKMAKLFQQTEVYNLDKRQAIASAFLMLQKPEYQGLGI